MIARPHQFQPLRPDRPNWPDWPDWVDVEAHDDRLVVRCRNRDLVGDRSVSELRSALGSLMGSTRRLELDLRSVHRLDTKLLAALVDALSVALASGVALAIHASPAMQTLIEICRLQGILLHG